MHIDLLRAHGDFGNLSSVLCAATSSCSVSQGKQVISRPRDAKMLNLR